MLFGPSGSGKSLTLQAIAGLLTPDAGRIELPDGRSRSTPSAGVNLPPQQRNVGYVVQDLALFPHLTRAAEHRVRARTAGPRRSGASAVAELIALLGLEGLERAAAAARSPAASSSASRWRARSRASPRCCCWTSRSPRSTRRCARRCAASWRRCGGSSG